MKDPDRLLEQAGSVEARLLAALDEPAPPKLLARTLAAVGAASVMPAAPSHTAPGATASVAAAKAAGSGILGAVGLGALAGLLTVGALSALPVRDRSARDTQALAAPPAVVVQAPPPIASAPAVAPSPSADAPAPSADVRPVTRAQETAAPTAAPSASASAKISHATLADEIGLLDEARRALHGGDAARAKTLMDRYAHEIPHGQLAREAALLRAQAAEAAARTNP